MAVLAVATKYHRLGRALRRIMNAENVQVASQADFADRITRDGDYPIGQQVISDYMRLHAVEDRSSGEMVERPRAIPAEGFILAVIRAFNLTPEQQEDVVTGWLAILPEKRREALLAICAALQGTDVSSEAWREMLDYEADRGDRENIGREHNERSAGNRGEAV